MMAPLFENVIGTDPSDPMIKRANEQTPKDKYPNVSYQSASAEDSPFLEAGSVDLVVAAQAAHWFDYPRLFPELSRVVRKGGTLAFFGYKDHVFVDSPRATEILNHYGYGMEKELLGPYWQQPGRSITLNKLRAVQPPENTLNLTWYVYLRTLHLAPFRAESESYWRPSFAEKSTPPLQSTQSTAHTFASLTLYHFSRFAFSPRPHFFLDSRFNGFAISDKLQWIRPAPTTRRLSPSSTSAAMDACNSTLLETSSAPAVRTQHWLRLAILRRAWAATVSTIGLGTGLQGQKALLRSPHRLMWKDTELIILRTVDFDSFSKVLNRPGGFRDPGEPEEYCRGFQVFDKEMTGFIGVGQLRYILTNLGEKMSDDEVDELLKAMDTSSGEINYMGMFLSVTSLEGHID
ncbi:trans-aconitate methyltransferase 1 [Zalaria obscura]|uniref:Trans-aconitate methyltransferase 1 n=1 Tax=Zalaria obscura TaxID=2024903 RepID=A0ACC3SEF5_9PEZI